MDKDKLIYRKIVSRSASPVKAEAIGENFLDSTSSRAIIMIVLARITVQAGT